MVTQRPLEPLFMVRVHAGQPLWGGMDKEQTRGAAQDLGFALCGFARASRARHADALDEWLANGNQATMDWLKRTAEDRADPRRLLPGVRSVVVLATNYFHPDPTPDSGTGRIAHQGYRLATGWPRKPADRLWPGGRPGWFW